MDDLNADRHLRDARLAEAQSLLAINQRRRTHAEATLVLIAVSGLLICCAAVWARRAEVFLPLPPIALLLTSLSFQQYAEVTVLGTARSMLETAVNGSLEGYGLIYEGRIAGIRKSQPLVLSVRVLQGLVRLLVLGGAVAGLAIALDQPSWVLAGYAIVTGASVVSCALSYRDMRRAGVAARTALADLGA